MKLLLIGYPGFVASEIKPWFESRGWKVDTLSLRPFPEHASQTGIHIVCDLAQTIPNLPDAAYDLVIHAAGKAHIVPKTDEDIRDFFAVNVTGTKNLLTALQSHPPKSLVFISSVNVYGKDEGTMINEDSPLNGKTPFAASKIQAEKVILETPFSQNVIRGIVRLPLVAGKNAPGNLGNMINAIKRGIYFNVSGGKAVRSVVMNSDIPPFLLALAEQGGIYHFTDGRGISFKELSGKVREHINCPSRPGLPYWIAWCIAAMCEMGSLVLHRPMPLDFNKLRKLVSDLTFDNAKAAHDFPFTPHLVIDHIKDIL